jgi:hypothetical protein
MSGKIDEESAMSPRTRKWFSGGLLVLALLGAAPREEEEKDTVEVALIAILATDSNDKIDPQLACIARQVRKTHKELTGFRLATTTKKSLAVGEKSIFEVVSDQKVAVTVEQGADEKNRVQLKVGPPGMGPITYDTCCGKFLPIVTPFTTKDKKELLIIAVRVHPCRER